MNRAAQFEARIEQLVFEPVHRRQLAVTRTSMPGMDDDLELRYSLSKHLAANRAAALADTGNIYYAVHEHDDQEDRRTAVLIFRQAVVAGRNTSKAHVLIGPADVLTPDSAVAMLGTWPWPLDEPADPAFVQRLEPIRLEEFRRAVDDALREAETWPATTERDVLESRQQIDRLLIALVQYGGAGLSAKVDPARRAALVRAVRDRLGPSALRWGFSMHEKEYKSPDLPALVFYTEETNVAVLSTRTTIDLDEVWLDESGLLGEAARRIVEAYRSGSEKRVLDALGEGFPGPGHLSLAECLEVWSLGGEVFAHSSDEVASGQSTGAAAKPGGTDPAEQETSSGDTADEARSEPGVDAGAATDTGANSGEDLGAGTDSDTDADADADADASTRAAANEEADPEAASDRGKPDEAPPLVAPDHGSVAAEPSRTAQDFVAGAQAPDLGLQAAWALWNNYLLHCGRRSTSDKPAGPPGWLLSACRISEEYLVMGWHMIDSRVQQYPKLAEEADSLPIRDLVNFVALSMSRPVATVTSTRDGNAREIGLPDVVRQPDPESPPAQPKVRADAGLATVGPEAEALTPDAAVSGGDGHGPVVDPYLNGVSTDSIGLVFAGVLIVALIFAAVGLALGLTR